MQTWLAGLLLLASQPMMAGMNDAPELRGREPVGRGARLFVTKCYPAQGKLSEQDFQQLAEAGFTVVVDRWMSDTPNYCRRAAEAGLDVMTWRGHLLLSPGPGDQTVTRLGKTTRYAVPYSPAGWKHVIQELTEQAKLSRKYANYKGVNLDFEIYDKNKTDGFCESYDDMTFTGYFKRAGREAPNPLPAPAQRHQYLKKANLLQSYISYQYALVAEQARRLRQAIDRVNPEFQLGVYGWGVMIEAVLENVATVKAPALRLDALTYGRTIYSNAFAGGYDGTEPDRTGLKWSLTSNDASARNLYAKAYPVVYLAGHYPQSPGPADGTAYKFTVRQAFNSAVYGDGYWIWTDWNTPKPWPTKEEWIKAMMAYFGQANAAVEAGDSTWSSRQKDSVPNPRATPPARIVTDDGKTARVWDAVTGERLSAGEALPPKASMPNYNGMTFRVNGQVLELIPTGPGKPVKVFLVGPALSGVAVGDVDGIAGMEVITLNAGWIKIWDPGSGALLLKFHVGGGQRNVSLLTKPRTLGNR